MNCNPCCGCCPPITTYNPSVADNFPTILQQVEYLKALLKKYPSQQWFISTEKVTPETVTITTSSIVLHERALQESDFILATSNDDKTTILLFQYVGASSTTLSVVEYVGIFSNQNIAEQALDLAKTNEQDIAKLDSEIVTKVEKIEKGTKQRLYTKEISGKDSFVESDRTPSANTIVRRNDDGSAQGNVGANPKSFVNKEFLEDGANNASFFDLIFRFLFLKGTTQNYQIVFEPQGIENNIFTVASQKDIKNQKFKTLFGNQTIVGTGNIDLYKHHIDIAGTYNGMQIGKSTTAGVEAFIEFYSSNNLKVDSLTDLKTLLGDTFMVGCKGVGWNNSVDKPIILDYMDESYLHAITDSFSYFNIPLSAITFTDTVKTI